MLYTRSLNIVFLNTVSEVICKEKEQGCFGLAVSNIFQVQQNPFFRRYSLFFNCRVGTVPSQFFDLCFQL